MDAKIDELIKDAQRCCRLAAYCTDRALAQRLLDLAREYCDRAVALGADPELLPGPETYRNLTGDDQPTSGAPPGYRPG